MARKNNRREFITQLTMGCASIGATTLLSSISNLGLINSAAAANINKSVFTPSANNYKALVCIQLNGGNDSYNMLIPRGNSEYAQYAETRSTSAIPQADLLAINPNTTDGKTYGLHPNIPNIQTLFENSNLAFIANIGALRQPMTKQDFQAGNYLPKGLYSHNNQLMHWHTSTPDSTNSKGWVGRMADIMQFANTNQNISMNISLSGLNRFQTGDIVQPYSINPVGSGAVKLNNSDSMDMFEVIKRQALDSLLEVNYANALDKAYNSTIKSAVGNSIEFSAAIDAAPTLTTVFPDTELGNSLKMIARTIATRNNLDMQHQTFFVNSGGWDTHFNTLTDHANLLTDLDQSLKAFYDALVELSIQNDVTTFSISDFGRKLIANGSGNDHAWGGNAIVMGGAVNGKEIYGTYPDILTGGNLDVGGGRFIPTTSCDEFFAELALWYGAASSDLDRILPNINNFWSPASSSNPIGFMS